MNMLAKHTFAVIMLVIACITCGCSCACTPAAEQAKPAESSPIAAISPFNLNDVPKYCGSPIAVVNGDMPFFSEEDAARGPFEEFAPLDKRGRCGVACALIDASMMPTEPRGSIGNIRPSGWHTARYPWINQEYLFNRCHLIGYQLTGQNANELNLITGTRSMNVLGMEPLEGQVADYIRENEGRVLYRATPVFEGENLVASGVLLEAQSIGGDNLHFCRFCYNVEPGVTIDYATGDNQAADDAAAGGTASEPAYILNTNSLLFHTPDCTAVDKIAPTHKCEFDGTREEALNLGFAPCSLCNP